jgi:long-chain acyl-CoA synthetase
LTGEVLKNGWLCTGDIGTVDEDGYTYITLRKKEFKKISGKGISPNEIKKVIVLYPGIVDCALLKPCILI